MCHNASSFPLSLWEAQGIFLPDLLWEISWATEDKTQKSKGSPSSF